MKLLTKYSRINLLTSGIILLLASGAYYFFLQYFLLQQSDDDLLTEKSEIILYAKEFHKLPQIVLSEDEVTTYQLVPVAGKTIFYNATKTFAGNQENFRLIKFYITINSKIYEIEIGRSLENTEAIIRLVIIITFITLIVLMFTSFLLNRVVLSRLWKPFYNSLKKVKTYRLGQTNFTGFDKTRITEFQMLNDTLQESITKNEADYTNLKAFTENASHEMQTPVAIIHSKIDNLIQDKDLSAAQSNHVQEAYAALQRLIRLNKSLLLLTKIENRQYTDVVKIDFETIISEKILQFQDLIEKKKINLKIISEGIPSVNMSEGLAEILLNNLLSNSIKFTHVGGDIKIIIHATYIDFCNGPARNSLDEKFIFNRFYKSGDLPDQHGLGLAIVKEICVVSGFEIFYLFIEQQHVFRIQF